MVKNDAGDTDLIPVVGLISGLISLGWVGKISGRRDWQPTPVFLPGESMCREAWQATVHRVAKSLTQLK